MKRLLIVLLACSTYCISACKKGDGLSTTVFGKWELRRTYGGGFVLYDSVYNPGNGTVYQFNRDSTYKHFTKNKLDAQGNFHLRKVSSPTANVIYFDNNQYGDAFSLRRDTMTIGTTATDGVASDYK